MFPQSIIFEVANGRDQRAGDLNQEAVRFDPAPHSQTVFSTR